MLARLTTWLFYAIVFFLLGVWVGGFSPGIRALLRAGVEQAQIGGEKISNWAHGTIAETPEPAAAPAATEATQKERLQSAREAFSRGDVSKAISLYQDLLKQYPNDVDARGELGNVLLGAGRLQDAARTYYETAVRLARAGDDAGARALAPIVRRNDPALADKLDGDLKTLDAR